MQELFLWLSDTIAFRFQHYFNMTDTDNPMIEPSFPEHIDWLQQPINSFSGKEMINNEEWVILLLGLAPHLSPQSLDLFLVKNENLNQPYTEFGGKHGTTHRSFLPTGETAIFLLSGDDMQKRIAAMSYFSPQHWLFASGILYLQQENINEPLLNRQLKVSDSFLNCLYASVQEKNSVLNTNSIKQAASGQWLDKQNARSSPCLACDSALCCKIFHLEDFIINSLTDFDKAAYYLNFENIELIFSPNGKCTVYYSKPCRFFDESNSTCRIHNQKQQSSICIHYNPYNCFYKKAEADKTSITNGNIWLNKTRLQRMQNMVLFNDDRTIAEAPSYNELVSALDVIPYSIEINNSISPEKNEIEEIFEPCSNCGALCCHHLLFPTNKPTNAGTLDFYQYALGFDGLEFVITDNAWAILVHTRCKHLSKQNHCNLFDKEERPLSCRYFDPYKCHVKQVLNYPNKIRADYDTFLKIKDLISFDAMGNFIKMPPIEKIIQVI